MDKLEEHISKLKVVATCVNKDDMVDNEYTFGLKPITATLVPNYVDNLGTIPRYCFPLSLRIIRARPIEPCVVIVVDCSTNADGSLKKMPLIPAVIKIQTAWRGWKIKNHTEIDYLYG